MLRGNARDVIVDAFQQGGCARIRDLAKRELHTSLKYKKGYEIRLPVSTTEEKLTLLEALELLGFRAGKPYPKHRQFIIPIYGKQQVEKFADLLERWRPG